MSDYHLRSDALHIPADGTSDVAPRDSSVTVNVQPGAASMNADGTTSTHRPQSYNTADFVGDGSGSILSTVRTKTGSPRMGPVEPSDIVLIEGRECQVQVAEYLGILKRDAQGNYTEVAGGLEAAKGEAKKQDEAPADAGEALADTQVETDLAALCGTVSAGLQVAALTQIIETGQASQSTVQAAASEARTEPGQMDERVQAVMGAFRAQAVTAVQAYGSDNPEEFFDWARENKSADFKRAMQSHGMERTTKAYEPIYREYVETVAEREPDRVLNAQFGSGITARLDDRKRVILSIPGRGEMPYRAALKAGFIKVSGA